MKNALNQEVWDVVIADTKLSEKTGFTENQKVAMRLGSYMVKANNSETDITGKTIDMKAGVRVYRNTLKDKFLKIYSNGNGIYEDIK